MEGTAELFTGFAERIAREKGTRQEMMREGDYIEDGLIHCGKCKGKRQTRVKIPGGDGTIVTPNGETVSAEIVQPGTQDATGVGYISHFATCPVANMFRRK